MIDAAVLIPVFRRPGEGVPRDDGEDLHLVIIRRAEGGIHGGQLAFPGGKRDPDDTSLRDTALRESSEEIGLEGGVEILEKLPPVGTLTSGFRVTPFLARIDGPRAWRLEEREVAEVLEVRLFDLERPWSHGKEMKDFPTWSVPRLIPFYRVGPYKLWGLTYRILRPLIPRLLAGEWEV